MALFSKVKDMYRVRKQAKSVKNELKKIHVEAQADELVTVVISAELEIIGININDSAVENLKTGGISKMKLEEALKKALAKALKKAQEISSEKMKGVWNELGINQ